MLLIYICECYIYYVYVYRKYLLLLLYYHIKQVLGIQLDFRYPRIRFWGWNFIRNGVQFEFRFKIQILVLSMQNQILHPIRTLLSCGGLHQALHEEEYRRAARVPCARCYLTRGPQTKARSTTLEPMRMTRKQQQFRGLNFSNVEKPRERI